MIVNKDLIQEIIETDELEKRYNLYNSFVDQLINENRVRDLADCAAQSIIHQYAIPKIPVTQTQFDEITKMFKIKGLDGRGGDRRSKKYHETKQ